MAEIKFDNVLLEEVAPHIKIDDIVVSPLSYNATVNDRPTQPGRFFVRQTAASRTVTITFALLTDNRDDREAELQAIRDWAKTDKEYVMNLPHSSVRHLECVCTEHPESSYRQWWQNRMRLVFTCYNNPFWTSDDLIQARCGQEFSVSGSAPPLMTITRNLLSAAQSQSYSNGTETMIFTTIPAGNLEIDLNRRTAAIGGTSIAQYITPTSRFLTPAVGGRQVIRGTGFVNIRERWV